MPVHAQLPGEILLDIFQAVCPEGIEALQLSYSRFRHVIASRIGVLPTRITCNICYTFGLMELYYVKETSKLEQKTIACGSGDEASWSFQWRADDVFGSVLV